MLFKRQLETTHALLNYYALEAAATWQTWSPAMIKGRPIEILEKVQRRATKWVKASQGSLRLSEEQKL